MAFDWHKDPTLCMTHLLVAPFSQFQPVCAPPRFCFVVVVVDGCSDVNRSSASSSSSTRLCMLTHRLLLFVVVFFFLERSLACCLCIAMKHHDMFALLFYDCFLYYSPFSMVIYFLVN
jgi:hypothetical protein